MEVLMELREIQMVEDPMSSQVVILGESDGERTFPIFIGQYEAVQLDMALHHQQYPRPLTHDLVLNAIEAMGGKLNRVIVDDLRADGMGGGTFYGKLAVTMTSGEEVLIDTRPSDAIVLATKSGVPIYVEDEVLMKVCGESE
ncbi:MAG: bifunctional nuclease family protein [Candidatus Sumerlaeota bacterium]|nr:bifunctional nuclease family protein [Candidatus Sumerlaeota bacterium]